MKDKGSSPDSGKASTGADGRERSTSVSAAESRQLESKLRVEAREAKYRADELAHELETAKEVYSVRYSSANL